MKSRSHYHAALAAEYALGTLRGAAKIQFEQKMRDDPEVVAEVARWQEAFTQLDNHIMPVIPLPRCGNASGIIWIYNRLNAR